MFHFGYFPYSPNIPQAGILDCLCPWVRAITLLFLGTKWGGGEGDKKKINFGSKLWFNSSFWSPITRLYFLNIIRSCIKRKTIHKCFNPLQLLATGYLIYTMENGSVPLEKGLNHCKWKKKRKNIYIMKVPNEIWGLRAYF